MADARDNKRALQALQGSEARKSAILALALDAIITTDDRGMVVEFNAAAERSFGCALEHAQGRDFVDFLVVPDADDADGHSFDRYLRLDDDAPLGRRREV